MKEGWLAKSIGEIAKVEYGYTGKAKPIGKFRYVRITDIDKNGELTTENKKYLEDSDDVNHFILSDNALLMARTGATFGKVLLYQNFEPSVFASYLIGIRFAENIENKLYWYFSKSNYYWDQANSLSSGSAQPHFNGKALKSLIFKYPKSIPEQKQIVAILDKAFAAIDQAKTNIEKNIENAKELFQSKLNEVFSQKGEGWEEKTLKEISIDFGRGKSKNRPRNDAKLFGGPYPFVQTGDVRNAGKTLRQYTQTYNEVGLSQSKLWPKGTICITIAANIAETAILDFDSCFPDSIIGLVVDVNKVDLSYTYYSLQFLKGKLQELGKGSAQDNINLGTFQKQHFPFPDIRKQTEIAFTLDKISDQINSLKLLYEQNCIELDELKKSILQKAFAGELT